MPRYEGTNGDDFYWWTAPDDLRPSRFYGLRGDDEFSLRSYEHRDRFYGGADDDTFVVSGDFNPLSALPRRGGEPEWTNYVISPEFHAPGEVRKAVFFHGGQGDDTLEAVLLTAHDRMTVDAGQMFGRLRSVETVDLKWVINTTDNTPVVGAKLKGTRYDDEIDVWIDEIDRAKKVTVDAGRGDDLVTLRDQAISMKVKLGAGDDVFEGIEYDHGDDFRFSDRLRIIGGKGDDDVRFSKAKEIVKGGSGDDVFRLNFWGETDTVSGGRGADTFVFRYDAHWNEAADESMARITDFRSGTDRIVLERYIPWPNGAAIELPVDGSYDRTGVGPIEYDRATGVLSQRGIAVLELDPGTKLRAGDVLGTFEFDDLPL